MPASTLHVYREGLEGPLEVNHSHHVGGAGDNGSTNDGTSIFFKFVSYLFSALFDEYGLDFFLFGFLRHSERRKRLPEMWEVE